MTYSTAIRQLVLKEHSESTSIRTLAKEFELSPQTIEAWKKNPQIKVEQLLIPELPDNSVIVMDNATFHMNEKLIRVWGTLIQVQD